ncbi:hypothetical protein LDVICp189 [lymphocystis disease virus-China]|uniref:Caspase-8-like n=2 Tax=Lymphocystis disease virus 2 TaxID=159183 RepID=A0A6F8WZV5_9VIRU|nr:hypothetical protein LDVICp189 [lymphocystis disease virus-China]AAU11033.1 hypothetical protein [lymphocystis disease virus-China]BCB67527.1 caspase-8-like [Lymphocystis disease virus 2]
MAQNLVRIHKIKIIYGGTKCYNLFINKLQEESLITLQEYVNLKAISLRQIRESVIELVESLRSKDEDCCRQLIKCLKQDKYLKPFFPFISSKSKCVKSLIL